MTEDNNFEYILKKNQNVIIDGREIFTNSYSMKNQEIDSVSKIYLALGDSFINGGVEISNQDLATTLLSESLTEKYSKKHQFLNISCSSWGPENYYQYILKNGYFNANEVFIFLSGHDIFDNMTFDTADYPEMFINENYNFAIYQLINEKLVKSIKKYFSKPKPLNYVNQINKLDLLIDYFTEKNIEVVIYFHPTLYEINQNMLSKNSLNLIEFAKNKGLDIINEFNLEVDVSYYEDNIHFNKRGHEFIYKNILKFRFQ